MISRRNILLLYWYVEQCACAVESALVILAYGMVVEWVRGG